MFEVILPFKDYLALITVVMAIFLSIVSIMCGRIVDETLPDTPGKKASKFSNPRTSTVIFTVAANLFVWVGAARVVTTSVPQLIAISFVSILFGFMVLFTVIAFAFAVCNKYSSKKAKSGVA